MIGPESLSQERIYQYNRHDKPRNLSKTIGVGGTDNQYPEGIGRQEGIVNPMIIFILEVPAEDIDKLAATDMRKELTSRFKEIGFTYVTLDLQGYQMGSMNAVLDKSITGSGKGK